MAHSYVGILMTVIALTWLETVQANEKFNNFSIFSILHEMPNKDPIRHYIQLSAIWSWSQLIPVQNIFLFFENSQSCSFVKQHHSDIKCITLPHADCIDATYDRPYIKCIFEIAQRLSQTSVLIFANGDIMLEETTFHSINFIADRIWDFFVVGCRRDYEIDLANGTDRKMVLKNAIMHSRRHHTTGIDLIAFRAKIHLPVLPFLVGVYRWDNWLLSEVILRTNKTVIDITDSSQIIHLQPKNTGNGSIIPHQSRPGADYNDALTKNVSGNDYGLGSIHNAQKILIGDCRNGKCILQDNFRQSERILIRQRANAEKYIAVLTVNSGYMELAWNWVSIDSSFSFCHKVFVMTMFIICVSFILSERKNRQTLSRIISINETIYFCKTCSLESDLPCRSCRHYTCSMCVLDN